MQWKAYLKCGEVPMTFL